MLLQNFQLTCGTLVCSLLTCRGHPFFVLFHNIIYVNQEHRFRCAPYLGWRRIFISLAGSPSSCSMSGNWNSKKYSCFYIYYSWEGTQPTMNNIWPVAENLYSRNWTYWPNGLYYIKTYSLPLFWKQSKFRIKTVIIWTSHSRTKNILFLWIKKFANIL